VGQQLGHEGQGECIHVCWRGQKEAGRGRGCVQGGRSPGSLTGGSSSR